MSLYICDLNDIDFHTHLQHTCSAIIPVGSLEQHGPHLPVSTDSLIAEHISIEAGRRLNYFVLPVVPFGVSFEHSPMFNISIRNSALSDILCDICISITRLGIKKIIIINGHHGNTGVLQYISQNTYERIPANSVVHTVNYWHLMGERFDHAGEVETSIMLAINPLLVKMDRAVPSSKTLTKSNEVYKSLTCRPGSFPELTGNGVWGNPKLASQGRGEQLLKVIYDKVCETILDFG